MDIEDLTLKQIREIQTLAPQGVTAADTGPWAVGQAYLIRCVSYHAVGRLVSVGASELVLADASWVADSGRYGEAVANGLGPKSETEYLGDLIVGRGAVVDAVPYGHELPNTTK